MQRLREVVRRRLAALSMRQQDLAEALSMSPGSLSSQLSRGHINPDDPPGIIDRWVAALRLEGDEADYFRLLVAIGHVPASLQPTVLSCLDKVLELTRAMKTLYEVGSHSAGLVELPRKVAEAEGTGVIVHDQEPPTHNNAAQPAPFQYRQNDPPPRESHMRRKKGTCAG